MAEHTFYLICNLFFFNGKHICLYIYIWVCVKTPGPRWICGSLLFNRVLNGGIEREVLNGGITGGIERRAFPKQTSHVTNGSKLTFVRVRVVCVVCVCEEWQNGTDFGGIARQRSWKAYSEVLNGYWTGYWTNYLKKPVAEPVADNMTVWVKYATKWKRSFWILPIILFASMLFSATREITTSTSSGVILRHLLELAPAAWHTAYARHQQFSARWKSHWHTDGQSGLILQQTTQIYLFTIYYAFNVHLLTTIYLNKVTRNKFERNNLGRI